jgi:uncharacterized protein (TIGR02145 family)
MRASFFILSCLFVLHLQGYSQKTIPLNNGWNNIGSVCTGAVTDVLTTDPPGIIASAYYGYNGAYYTATTLETGVGYWVKVNGTGSLTYTCGDPDPCGVLKVGFGGRIYNTIEIGGQCWLKENMNIGVRVDGSVEQLDNEEIEKYCYDDDPANCETHGGLYQWAEAMQYATQGGSQGICPPGWHVPTSADFQTVITNVSNDGNALKEIGEGSGAGEGTNTSGFSVLLAGDRDATPAFSAFDQSGYFWTSTSALPDVYSMNVDATTADIYLGLDFNPVRGFSIRCQQD